MSGRQARLPVDTIIRLPHLGHDVSTHELTAETQVTIQLAFQIAQRSLAERSNKQCWANQTMGSYPVLKPDQEEVLLYKPHRGADRPGPKLLFPSFRHDARSGDGCPRSCIGSDHPFVIAETFESFSLISSCAANKHNSRLLISSRWTLCSLANRSDSRCYSPTQTCCYPVSSSTWWTQSWDISEH